MGWSEIGEEKQVVLSEPLAELVGGGRNAKYVRDCFELHLGRKGIEKLSGFERLVNLEVLDASHNKLTFISGLEANFRLKRLYLNDNKLFTLRGPSIKATCFLELLDLANNNLRDLHKVLALLQHMRFLQQLDLSGNPCGEEPDYRYHVINKLPSLHILDSHEVTQVERDHTKRLFGYDTTSSAIAFGTKAPPKPPPVGPMPLGGSISQLESELNADIDAIKAKRRAELVPEVTQVLGLSMADATATHTQRRTLPPPPGWKKAQEPPSPSSSSKPRAKGDPLMRGVKGRPRAQDYFQLTHLKSNWVDGNPGWALPADHDPDFVPSIKLQQKKHDRLREWHTKLGPVSMDTYRPLI